MASKIYQNYHRNRKLTINHIINMVLTVYYTYPSIAHYFEVDNVALEDLTSTAECLFDLVTLKKSIKAS
uniref:Uncharacterized protein n=1 Tax=Erpetoichthys calabaricus TaxID=27687 RepID=A0A8C4SE02_ERPCA